MKLALIILSLLLTACESPPVRRDQAIRDHPEWTAQTKAMIQSGYLLKGMTEEQVIATWGKPCLSCTGTVAGSSFEYPTQIVFFDDMGKVSRIEAK